MNLQYKPDDNDFVAIIVHVSFILIRWKYKTVIATFYMSFDNF